MTAASPPPNSTIAFVLSRLDGVQRAGSGWKARCPCPGHDDARPSLGVNLGEDGRVLLNCRSKHCPQGDIVKAAGLKFADLYPPKAGKVGKLQAAPKRGKPDASYKTCALDGSLVAVQPRFGSGPTKDLWWEEPNGKVDLGSQRVNDLPLYGSEKLPTLADGAVLVAVEGQPAAQALLDAGISAVGTYGTSHRPTVSVLETISRFDLRLWADEDTAGVEHMEQVAGDLADLGVSVRMINWPEAPPKGDAVDFMASHDRADTLRLIEAAVEYTPPPPATNGHTQNRREVSSDNSFIRTEVFRQPYPVEVLPSVFQTFVIHAARAVGVPPEMVALPCFAYMGSTIGNRYRIELKPRFEQSPTIWGVVVAPAGAAKSPAEGAAREPVEILQREAMKQYDADLTLYEEAIDAWSVAKKVEKGVKPRKPEPNHFFSTDTTIEALCRILDHSPGVTLLRDELVGWVRSFDAYKKGRGGERQQYLSAWAGAPIKVDRKGADSLFIEHPVVCVTGGIQPDVLGELSDEAGNRDGFLERFLWSRPEVGPVVWNEDTVPQKVVDKLLMVFREWRAGPSAATLTLSDAARAEWVSWFNENGERTSTASGLMAGVAAKLPLQLARLVLILHCVEQYEAPGLTPVAHQTMVAGIDLVEYHWTQAHACLQELEDLGPPKPAGLGVRILRILKEAEDKVPKAQIHSKLGGHVTADILQDFLDQMISDGLAAHEKGQLGESGGRPAELYWYVGEETEETN